MNKCILLWPLHTILESFPVSSSGHLYLIRSWLNCEAEEQNESCYFLMHVPVAISLLLFLTWWYVSYAFNHASLSDWMALGAAVFCANAMTGILYYLNRAFGLFSRVTYAMGFFITTLALIVPLMINQPAIISVFAVSSAQALGIGLFQGIALAPGVSRLAITVAAGVFCGLDPLTAFIFSLTIELPLVCAGILKGLLGDRIVLSAQSVSYVMQIIAIAIAICGLRFTAYTLSAGFWWIWPLYCIIPLILSIRHLKA